MWNVSSQLILSLGCELVTENEDIIAEALKNSAQINNLKGAPSS